MKHSKYKYTYYQNTHTIVKTTTHTHTHTYMAVNCVWQLTLVKISNAAFSETSRNINSSFMWRCSPTRAQAASKLRCRGRAYTLGRSPLVEGWARDRDLQYLTTHNTHKREISMPPAEFEPAIPPNERPQNHDLDRATTYSFIYVA